jgi:hypothetical protein
MSSTQAVIGAAVLRPKRQATAIALMLMKSAIWAPNSIGLP